MVRKILLDGGSIAGQLRGFNPADHIDADVLPFCDRFTQLAIVAGDPDID